MKNSVTAKNRKSSLLFLIVVFIALWCRGQAVNPVSWIFTAKPLNDTTVAVYWTAIVAAPYHIYAQDSPEGLTLPTKIVCNRNPILSPLGKYREEGKLEQSEVDGVMLKYYSQKVSFVQLFRMKPHIKTNLSGTIEFMACTQTHCLPPQTQRFLININKDNQDFH